MDFMNGFQLSNPELLNDLIESFSISNLLFGLSIGLFSLLLITLIVKKIPLSITLIIPAVTCVFFAFLEIDKTQILNLIDVPISAIFAYLYIRMVMSCSRSLLMGLPCESPKFKEIIIIISFLSISFTGFLLYNCFEKNNQAYIIYFFNAAALLLTLFLDVGILSDGCLVCMQSILSFSSSSQISTFISVFRLSIILLSFLSPLVLLKSSEIEQRFLFFRIKKLKTRIILTISLFSYFYISPNMIYCEGSKKNIVQSYLVLVLYSVFLINEYINNSEANFYGYH